MSRCVCCNRILSEFEMTRKHKVTGEYIMICDHCLPGLGIPTTSRVDLGEDLEDDLDGAEVEVYQDLANNEDDERGGFVEADFMDFDEGWLSSDDR